MQQDLNRVIEQVSKEKGIDKSILIAALEHAMVSAAKKTFGHQRKIEAQFNPEIGEVELFEAKTVVESVTDSAVEVTLNEAKDTLDPDAEIGDELLCKLDSSMFGRIAAQAAKQNIVQRVRDAEREIIYNEFKGRSSTVSCNGLSGAISSSIWAALMRYCRRRSRFLENVIDRATASGPILSVWKSPAVDRRSFCRARIRAC
jgi:hypothetical protein